MKATKLETLASTILVIILGITLLGLTFQFSGIDPFKEANADNATMQAEVTNRTVDVQEDAHLLELKIGNYLWNLRVFDALLLAVAILGLIAGARHMFGKLGLKEV